MVKLRSLFTPNEKSGRVSKFCSRTLNLRSWNCVDVKNFISIRKSRARYRARYLVPDISGNRMPDILQCFCQMFTQMVSCQAISAREFAHRDLNLARLTRHEILRLVLSLQIIALQLKFKP